MDVVGETLVVDGDTVGFRDTILEARQGPFRRIEPTGAAVEIADAGTARVEDGQLVEVTPLPDVLDGMQQLGSIGSPGQYPTAAPFFR